MELQYLLQVLENVVIKLKEPVCKERVKGLKGKRVDSPATSPDTRGNYPPETKPLYLKAKNLYRRKLNLAVNLHSIKSCLENGNFHSQYNFRGTPLPPESTEEAFKQKWTDITSKCKRELTLIWADEINRKYSNVKLEIQSTLTEMETHLNQFKKIKDSLSSMFQVAAPSTLQQKMKTGLPQKANFSKPERKNWQGRRPMNPNRQLNMLLSGLNKLIQNKAK